MTSPFLLLPRSCPTRRRWSVLAALHDVSAPPCKGGPRGTASAGTEPLAGPRLCSALRGWICHCLRMRGWAASQGSWPGAWAWRKCDPSQCPQDLGIQSLCRGERGSVTHVGPHPSWGSPGAAVSAAPGGPSSPAVVLRVEAALLSREVSLHQDAWGCFSVGICGPGTETALGSVVLLP